MSIDDLNKILTASKWALGILAVLTALAGLFNQWVSDRISKLQAAQRVEAQDKLQLSEAELQRTQARTAQLENKLAPRSLSSDQQKAVIDAISQFTGTQFQFVSYQDDAEVRGLVLGLIRTLLGAGWKGIPANAFLMASLVEGVLVEYAPSSSRTLGPAAAALASALDANGIKAAAQENAELGESTDRIRIKVGKKPS